MKVYVINMKRSKNRRDAMVAQLEALGISYEIVEAVDGKAMSEEAFLKSTNTPQEFTRSQAGCALSHNKVYKKMQNQHERFALVLEDDVLITEKKLLDILETLDKTANPKAITLLTYFWCREGQLELSAQTGKILKGFFANYNICTPADIHGIGRAAAYILSKETAKKILDYNTPLVCQADSWIVYHMDGLIDTVDCVYPMPITENADFGSEIGYTQNRLQEIGKKLVEKAVAWNIPLIAPAIKKRRMNYSNTYKNIVLKK